MLGHTRPLSFPSARYWYVFLCVGCAQLAGFEDFHGATVEGGEGGAGGVTAALSGGSSSANAGRPGGGSSGRPGSGGTSDGGEPQRPEAGDTSVGDAGEGGATGSAGSLNGGAPSTGGVADTGGSVNGGSSNGGNATGGITASGGSPTGGTANGGSATGGSATGGKASDPCGQLLVNPAFASGSDGWTETSSYPGFVNNLHPIIAADTDPELAALSVSPQSDDYLLWLGGIPDSNNTHTVTASQVVTLSPKHVISTVLASAGLDATYLRTPPITALLA